MLRKYLKLTVYRELNKNVYVIIVEKEICCRFTKRYSFGPV